MSREEFHRAYERTRDGFKAELIGGIVYVGSPLTRRHGANHTPLATVFFAYEGSTPGVESGDNTTILLGADAEPQPDLYLRILPEHGGQSSTTAKDYVSGAPELVAEIALSSRSIDLHVKLDDYAKHGVREYLVLCLQEKQLRWFDLRKTEELALAGFGWGLPRSHVSRPLGRHQGIIVSRLQRIDGDSPPRHPRSFRTRRISPVAQLAAAKKT